MKKRFVFLALILAAIIVGVVAVVRRIKIEVNLEHEEPVGVGA